RMVGAAERICHPLSPRRRGRPEFSRADAGTPAARMSSLRSSRKENPHELCRRIRPCGAEDRLDDYKKLAELAGTVWMEHGATAYVEALGDDVPLRRADVVSA